MVSRIRRSVGASVTGLTRRGILVFQQARVHIFEMRPNLRYRRGAASAITGNLFLDKMRALRGAIYRYGSSFTKRASKCLELGTQTPLPTTSKRNTSLRRNSSARFVGISNSSATLVILSTGIFVGVKISRGLTWRWV